MADKKWCQTCNGTGEHPDPELFWRMFETSKREMLQQIEAARVVYNMQAQMLTRLRAAFTPQQMKIAGFHNPKGLKKK